MFVRDARDDDATAIAAIQVAGWRGRAVEDDGPIGARLTIATDRLALRPFSPDDKEAAFSWFGDPEVMKFTPTGPDASLESTAKRLAGYQAHQSQHGFSKWLVVESASGRPIGDSGLLVMPDGKIDLGFRFARSSWGKGFATEVASAWIRAAFGEFRLPRLTAFAHVGNHASLRVLEKVGFQPGARETVMGMDAMTFWLRHSPTAGRTPPGRPK